MQIDGKVAAPIHAFVVIRLLPARRKDGQGSNTNCIICKVLDLFFDDHHIGILVTWTQATNRFLPRWVECTPQLWIKLWTRLIMVLPSICLSHVCINMFIITFWPAIASLYPSRPPPNLRIAKVKETLVRPTGLYCTALVKLVSMLAGKVTKKEKKADLKCLWQIAGKPAPQSLQCSWPAAHVCW